MSAPKDRRPVLLRPDEAVTDDAVVEELAALMAVELVEEDEDVADDE